MSEVTSDAENYFDGTVAELATQELIASTVYSEFTTGTMASKAIAAQYLAESLERTFKGEPDRLKDALPQYLTQAIEYVTEPLTPPAGN